MKSLWVNEALTGGAGKEGKKKKGINIPQTIFRDIYSQE